MKPTVGDRFPGVETYLFDCDEQLYGKQACVRLHHFLRPEFKVFPLLRNCSTRSAGMRRSVCSFSGILMDKHLSFLYSFIMRGNLRRSTV